MSKASDEELQELNRQRDVLEKKKEGMGSGFYGYSNEGTKGFHFESMMTRKAAWDDPVVYHSANASGCFGSAWGLWFFFREPVHNKLYHICEMVRRTLQGSLVAFPFCMGVAWYARKSSQLENERKLRERGDTWRKDYMAEGGKVMEAPPDPTYSGPQGMPEKK